MNDVARRLPGKLDGARENNEVGDRNGRHNFSECATSTFVPDQRVQEAPSPYSINAGPLRFVLIAENGAIAVHTLNAEYAACGQYGVIDVNDAAVCTRQDEIVQDVGTAPVRALVVFAAGRFAWSRIVRRVVPSCATAV